MSDYKYVLPRSTCVTAADCRQLLEAIQRGDLDEFDLKNEINMQWQLGYNSGSKATRMDMNNAIAGLAQLRASFRPLEES